MYYYGLEPFLGPYGLNGPYIGEDPTATLGEILDGRTRISLQSIDLRLDRRPRRRDDDVAEL